MKPEAVIEYLQKYRGPELRIMEVCGTHTAAIFKSGLRSLLPASIRLISGPGCPVCVTPTAYIDRCVACALKDRHTVVSFGDMMKVPGTETSLAGIRGEGGSVSLMYSPLEAVEKARRDPDTLYVVAAVGFETTAPAHALAIREAAAGQVENLRFVTALKTVAPALSRICQSEPDIAGFLCPGHVSVITGPDIYRRLAEQYRKPFVIAGFEAEHLLAAVFRIVRLAERQEKDPEKLVCNLYPSVVREDGNPKARALLEAYFETGAATWRGLGEIADSGFYLKPAFAAFDDGSRGLSQDAALPAACRCGDVITGRVDPPKCPLFAKSCTPQTPWGPCMVSAEGACGIWYQNRAE